MRPDVMVTTKPDSLALIGREAGIATLGMLIVAALAVHLLRPVTEPGAQVVPVAVEPVPM